MKYKYSIKLWLFVLFVLCILLPLTILSFLLSAYFNRTLIEADKKSFTNTLYSISKSVRVYLDDLKDISLTPYYYSDIMGYMTDINSGKYFSDQSSQININQNYMISISHILNTSRTDVADILFIPMSKTDTGFVVQHNAGKLRVISGQKFFSQQWFKEAVAQDGKLSYSAVNKGESSSYNDTNFISDDSSIFSVTRVIKNTDTSRKIGVLKIEASDSVIKDIFDNIQTGYNSALMLIDNRGSIIYSTKAVGTGEIAQIRKSNGEITFNGDTFTVIKKDINSTPWQLVYLSSQKDVQAVTMPIYIVTILIGISCLVSALIIFIIKSKSILSSVNLIIESIKIMEKGNLKIRINVKGNNEFSLIAQAFNHMAKKLEIQINKEYKAVLSQRNAEYIALQTQINPHFFYNTLNGFVTLNRIGNKKVLEQSIIRLTHLFRYTCSGEKMSTVKDEFDFVEKYLALQKLRFDTRLEYIIDADEEAGKIVIPKLLIQPAVENSIIHGLEPCEDTVFIQVFAFIYKNIQNKKFLIMIVDDNGVGFEMTSLNSKETVGLKNVAERVDLFKPDSIFTITSSKGKGTRCIYIISL